MADIGNKRAGATGGDKVHAPLSPAAKRALDEAEARHKKDRRKKERSADDAAPQERGGRDGPDPIRYGDWEKGGIVSDF